MLSNMGGLASSGGATDHDHRDPGGLQAVRDAEAPAPALLGASWGGTASLGFFARVAVVAPLAPALDVLRVEGEVVARCQERVADPQALDELRRATEG